LGQTVRHAPEHAKAVADIGVLPRLMEMPVAEYSSEDLAHNAHLAEGWASVRSSWEG